MPNQVTLSKFPAESKVETSSGKPKKLSVIVSVPLALTVSVPPNKVSKKASRGGTFKVGGAGGGAGGAGGAGGDGGNDELTVSV